MVHALSTDIAGLNVTSHYLDDSTPGAGAETRCTGDAQAFGESGPWINSTMPNTDPRTTPFNSLSSTRTIYFEAPGKANGAARAARAGQRLPDHGLGGPLGAEDPLQDRVQPARVDAVLALVVAPRLVVEQREHQLLT